VHSVSDEKANTGFERRLSALLDSATGAFALIGLRLAGQTRGDAARLINGVLHRFEPRAESKRRVGQVGAVADQGGEPSGRAGETSEQGRVDA